VRKLQLLVVAVAAALLAAPAPAAPLSGGCTAGWSVSETLPAARLVSVSLVPGTREAWTVGSYDDRRTGFSRPLIMHFNGRHWRSVRSPEPAGKSLSLTAVFARSRADVWAVGSYRDEQDEVTRTLVEHWDGAKWSIVPSPTPRSTDGQDAAILRDVVALDREDVAAVGHVFDEEATPQMDTLAERSSGSGWMIMPSSSPGGHWNRLRSLARVPRFDTLWAVGTYESGDRPILRPLVQRFRDGAWMRVWAPAVPGGSLHGVTALAWDNVWAVGSSAFSDGSALILQRSGTKWRVVPSPPSPVAGTYARLRSVSPVSAIDIWAVGHLDQYPDGDSSAHRGALMQHWDGWAWSIVPSPLDDATAVLTDVAMDSSGYGWSVGYTNGSAVVLRHCVA
jgi:hypothetical protein